MSRRPTKEQSLDLIKSRGIEFKTILDVGILTGTPELIKGFPDKHHVLFEPVIEFKSAIEEAYRGISHEFINCAISDVDGEVTLETKSVIAGVDISHSSIVDGPAASSAHRTVPMFKMDSFLADYPREGPYLLKIDIDGHELKVIEGAHLTLQQTSIVIIEADHAHIAERLIALQHHGFEILDIVEPCYYDDAFWQCDIVLIKPELKRKAFKSIKENFDLNLYIPYRE
ncbi:FkbM family methyltransferase [Methylobacterium sp.]|jgi:FkbM family methyltransferase|uniref:FkbM family methyltransferase n=1 Tax=Methylobacterium sp. TaxID=409 RepID=UPI000C44636A|nr:FkbM family methyltransferase [Methylobacterium sp.]MBP29428.1 hypothetical protein [Methylobacterium sp.]